ncbi:MAG: hypothetical protein EBS86_06380 [Crocinitomicaceae bacterium]|nr:hypothetical protein [Crocinitomicaceae bacterium]
MCSFNETYLPALLKLHKHYQDSEEFGKAKSLEKYIVSISEKSGQQGEVLELLENDETSNSILINTLLDVKTIEKNMLPINEKVFVAKYETSNEEYKKFLANLQRSKKTELYKLAVFDTMAWVTKYKEKGGELWMKNYHNHIAYNKYPAVTIPYEGAKAYCEWLTQQYNSQRKRKFTQVLFRLPTEQEWKLAAGSGNANAKTPFENDNLIDKSGYFLAIVKSFQGKTQSQPGDIMVEAISFSPNKLGFHHTLGNVAEMIDKKGIAKGGSWYNTFEESTFDKQQTYTSADPGIGFRIVMEVIVK